MKLIKENLYNVIYSPESSSKYELYHQYIASSIEEAIQMCREQEKGCLIKEVRFIGTTYRNSVKTITVEV